MNQTRFQQAVNRVAHRHLSGSSEGQQFVREVEKGLESLKDAIDLATMRSSHDPEVGQSLADADSNAAHAVQVIHDFAAKIDPLLRRIR